MSINLPIRGRPVGVVGLSRYVPGVRLTFWSPSMLSRSESGPEFVHQIESAFRLYLAGEPVDVMGSSDPHCTALVSKTVAEAFAADDGELTIEFSDGDRLVVPPYELEAWQLAGEDGSLLVCTPGGGLAQFVAAAGGPALGDQIRDPRER